MAKNPKEQTPEYQMAQALVKSKGITDLGSVQSSLNEIYSNMLQILLEAEMEECVGYNKGSHKNKTSANRRNGYSSKNKKIKTDNGVISIDMPRDRDGNFDPKILAKRQRVLSGLDEVVISMYAKGNSLEDIKGLIEKLYKIKLSNQTLSNMTESVNKDVEKWQRKTLKPFYSIVYVDCIYCYVKKDLVSEKTAVYVAIGIDIDGVKEVLGIYIDKNESATFWQSIFEDFKERGVEDILFVCMDGLTGLPDAINRVFPKIITQNCIVHIVRNIYNSVNKKEAKEIIQDFKKIYTASNKSGAKAEYLNFKDKYKDNTKLITRIDRVIEHVFGLFDYPTEIRKLIYTTNAIESVNSCLRKATRGRGSFINITALMKVLYLRIMDLETKWAKGTQNWKKVREQLIYIFGERVLKYTDIS